MENFAVVSPALVHLSSQCPRKEDLNFFVQFTLQTGVSVASIRSYCQTEAFLLQLLTKSDTSTVAQCQHCNKLLQSLCNGVFRKW